jgi:hypothetical protein
MAAVTQILSFFLEEFGNIRLVRVMASLAVTLFDRRVLACIIRDFQVIMALHAGNAGIGLL